MHGTTTQVLVITESKLLDITPTNNRGQHSNHLTQRKLSISVTSSH